MDPGSPSHDSAGWRCQIPTFWMSRSLAIGHPNHLYCVFDCETFFPTSNLICNPNIHH